MPFFSFAMLRKPMLLLTSSRRLKARWSTAAASTNVAAKVANLVDALEYLQKWRSNTHENANDFIELTWSSLPWSTKRRYKSFKDGQTFLLMDYHFEALKKLKQFDEVFILPRQHFEKAKLAEVHKMLPQETREAANSQPLMDLTSKSWLTLASAQRLKYSWYAYREVTTLKGSVGFSSQEQEAQTWYRLIRAIVRNEIKRGDHNLRQFELDLAAWEAKMATAGLSHVTKRLQGLEQHQLLLRLSYNPNWWKYANTTITLSFFVTVTLAMVAVILDELAKRAKKEQNARAKK